MYNIPIIYPINIVTRTRQQHERTEHKCFIDFHVPTLVPRHRLLQQLTFQDLKDLIPGRVNGDLSWLWYPTFWGQTHSLIAS